MKEAVLAAVLGGTIAGALSAGFVTTFLAGEPAPAAQPSLTPGAPATAGADSTQLGELSEQLTSLSMRLAVLENRASERVEAVAMEGTGELETSARLEQLLNTLSSPGSAVDPLFQSKVAAAIDRIEDEKAQEREREEFEEIQQEVLERLDKLQPELGLDAAQRSSMETLLVDSRVKRNELFRAMREGGDFSRDSFRELRDETETALSGILSPTQLESYEASERSERGWGRGPGGFSRGGDSGGGPGGGSGGGRGGGGGRGN